MLRGSMVAEKLYPITSRAKETHLSIAGKCSRSLAEKL